MVTAAFQFAARVIEGIIDVGSFLAVVAAGIVATVWLWFSESKQD